MEGMRTTAPGPAAEGARRQSPARHAPGPVQSVTHAQPALVIGKVDDPLEHEADRLAALVMRMPARDAPIVAAPLQVSRKCAACEEEEEALQRKPQDSSNARALQASDAVYDTLRAPGHPLDAPTRAFFEPRFGHDFSRVRVHSDSRANESSRAVDALAYTVGNHIVLGEGQRGNRALLAHELVHVMQQTGGRPVLRRFRRCRHLLDAPAERNEMQESEVRNSIADEVASLGPVEREFSVLGGSAAPLRTEHNPRRGKGDVIDPQIIGADIYGRADIVMLAGNALEGIEVKRATWSDAVFAERQLLTYVFEGGRSIGEVNRIWKGRGHPGDRITSVRAMPMSRLPLAPTRTIKDRQVALAWCRDGVIMFKSVNEEAQDVLLCGVSDQGRIDAFLNRAMDPAQAAVERYIQQEIEAPVIRKLGSLSLRDILRRALASPQVRRVLPLGNVPGGDEVLVQLLVEKLEPFEGEIRMVVDSFVHRVITELRKRVQMQIRNLLQDSMAALCVKATQMTLAELQKEFEKRMRQLTIQLVPVVIEAVATEIISELLVEAAKALAAAVAIVIAAIVLWEVAAALAAIEGIGALLAGLGAAIARLLAAAAPLFAW